MITDAQLDQIEIAARRATPGNWRFRYINGSNEVYVEADTSIVHICDDEKYGAHPVAENNQLFMAAANPQVVLQLIAMIRQLKQS